MSLQTPWVHMAQLQRHYCVEGQSLHQERMIRELQTWIEKGEKPKQYLTDTVQKKADSQTRQNPPLLMDGIPLGFKSTPIKMMGQ